MLTNLINDTIRCHVAAHHSKITVVPGACRWNFRCHNNAVHEAIERGHSKLALVVYFDNDVPIVHFINFHSTDDFQDNTLGHWCKHYEYYFIRWVNENEFFDVYQIHRSMRKRLNKCLPWWLRLFVPYERS